MLQDLGGTRWQVFLLVYLCLALTVRDWWFYEIGFFIQAPVYECTWNGPAPDDPSSVCTATNICDGDPIIKTWKIDYSNPDSLKNWQ